VPLVLCKKDALNLEIMKCKDEKFISNLKEINKKAGVDPEIVDLIVAYANLCLKDKKEVNFYINSPVIKTKKPTIKRFIEKNPHLDRRSLSFLVSYSEMMRDKGLPVIFNNSHLAHFLGLKEEELYYLVKEKERYYYHFCIPKSNGGIRHISAPKDKLKDLQKKILRDILERVSVHPAVNGFKKGKSIITNAENHVGQEVLVKIDLKDFFPSISLERIKGVYLHLGYPEKVAEMLAELSTYKGRLPMGAPTSPYLSNIVARRLDVRFTNLGKEKGFRYTRYADDLAFSSKNRDLNRYIPLFIKIIREEGFEVNKKKIIVARKGGQQKVTGVVVNTKTNIDRKEYKRLRAILYNCLHGDLKREMVRWGASSFEEFKNALRGHINFVMMLNKEKGRRLFESFAEILWPV
jgi:RNA-directed DNA polymerase